MQVLSNAFLYHSSTKSSEVLRSPLSSETAMVSENEFIFIELIFTERLLHDHFIWLSDFRYPINLDKIVGDFFYYSIDFSAMYSPKEKEMFSGEFETSVGRRTFSKTFINNYGICELELEYAAGSQLLYHHIGFIEVYSDKIQDIEHVLEYLFKKDIYIWNIVSLTRGTALDVEKMSDSLFWKLANIKRYVDQIGQEFVSQASSDPIYMLRPKHYVGFPSLEATISEESLLWIVENGGQLEDTTVRDENHFLILNRPYKANQLLLEQLFQDTDVYENRVIHWFIQDIYTFLIASEQLVVERYSALLEKTLQFKDRIFLAYFKRLSVHIYELKTNVEFIKNQLDVVIPANNSAPLRLEFQKAVSKPHYYNTFLNLGKWLDNRQVIYAPDLLFSGLKDVSKLYEIFCLYKILDTLQVGLNFTLLEDATNSADVSKYFHQDIFLEESQISSLFEFQKGNIRLRLFYDCLPPSLTTIAKTGGRDLRPDYVIEISKDRTIRYLILDAKYKRVSNIESFDFQNLCLKYLHGIGPSKGGPINALALLILNPAVDSKIGFYHRKEFDIFSSNPVLPIIGRIEVSAGEQTSTSLFDILNVLIEFVEFQN